MKKFATKPMMERITTERLDRLFVNPIETIGTQAKLTGVKLGNDLGKEKNYLIINIGGEKVTITIGDKAFKQMHNAILKDIKHRNTLDEQK